MSTKHSHSILQKLMKVFHFHRTAVNYALKGFALGLLFPIAATWIYCIENQASIREAQSLWLIWIIDTAPFVFAAYAMMFHKRQTDIKEQQTQNERLEMLAFSSELGLWDWNLSNNHVHYDERWCAMLGYQRNELAADLSTWQTLVHPDDLQSSIQSFTEYLEGRNTFYEVKFKMKTSWDTMCLYSVKAK